jgi:IPT/TIG domain/Bacterial Ig domain/Putative Ig domain
MLSLPAQSILLAVILVLTIPALVGCAAAVSPAKSDSTPGPTLQIASTSLATGAVGASYSATLVATGGVQPYTWTMTGGALPGGLQLNTISGAITGTPTLAGSFSFTVQVQDAKGSFTSASLPLSISPAPAPTISSVSPNSGPISGGTTVTISGSNFRLGAAVQFGSTTLPSAQVVSPAQIQAVTPAESSGTVGVTVLNTDGQTATAANVFTFTRPTLQVTTSSLPAGIVGTNYSTTLAATGGVPPYSWSTASGALPAGVQLNTSTGVIGGTPTLAGSFSFTVQVQDAKTSSSAASLSLSISPPPAPTISGVSPNSGTSSGGTAVTISGSNFQSGAAVQFGSFPAAAIQVVNSGQIRTVTPAEQSGVVNITVKDSDGQIATASNIFTFTAPPLQITTTSLPVGSVGASYSATLTATGGTPPYAWRTSDGMLPSGLQLNASSGAIAGTPTQSGNFSFTTRVQDAKAASSSASFSLAVSAAPLTDPVIDITSPSTGSTVSGIVTISASVTDSQSSIASVQFYLNGVALGTAVKSNPFTESWDTTKVVDGNYNLSAEATDAAGKTATSSAITITVNNPSSNPSVPASLFGLTVLNFSKLTPSMHFGTTRSWDAYPGLDWSDANPSAGTYNFANLDAFITINQTRGADIIYTFGRTPQWASSQPNAPGSYGPGECAPPVDMSSWDNYVRAIATHAAGRIKYWELWNEPQGAGMYCGDIPTMVTMAQHAFQIIKGIDPTALILSPGVTGGPGPTWLASFLAGGGAVNVDVIAFHGYWSATAEDIVKVVSSYTTVMAANGVVGKPTWDTEASWAGFGNLGTPSSSVQVGFVAKYYLLHWSEGIERFVWYGYDGGPIWGGLWSASGGESPAATSYKETYRWMVGATLTSPCSEKDEIWTCTFSRPGGYSAVAVWNSNASVSFAVPAQYTVYRDLEGSVHTITNNAVTIGNQPILMETTDSSL